MLLCLLVPALTTPVPPQAARLEFRADRQEIQAGETVQIYWIAVGCQDVLLEPLGYHLPAQGKIRIQPDKTTTYWLSAVNEVGGMTLPLTIVVMGSTSPPVTLPPPTAPPPTMSAPPPPTLSVPPPATVSEPPTATPGQLWIQVAALTNRAKADQLAEELFQLVGERPIVQEVPDPKGLPRTIMRVRFGPFPNIKEARLREKAMGPKLKKAGLVPMVWAQ